MVAVRNLIVLGVLAVAGAACPARISPPQHQGDDAAVLPPADAGMDAVNLPDLAIERPPAAVELCGNGLDDDGDGRVDEGCVCAQGAAQDCYPGPMRLSGVGTCAAGRQTSWWRAGQDLSGAAVRSPLPQWDWRWHTPSSPSR